MLNKLDYRNLKSTIPLNATKIGRSDLHLIMTTEQNEFLAQLCLWIRVALASATDQNMSGVNNETCIPQCGYVQDFIRRQVMQNSTLPFFYRFTGKFTVQSLARHLLDDEKHPPLHS
jgi:hypothetical protein